MKEIAEVKDKVFFTQLDGLRCFAVMLTMIAHWFPAVGFKVIPYTWNGVEVFFVISGFLITLLLIRRKEKHSASSISIIKNFVVRRVLRLFPVYYLFVLFFYVAYKYFHLMCWIPELGKYLFTYTSNIFYAYGGRENGIFEHTWSLAVEEQFYLVWPWLIIFIPYKKLGYVIVGIIVLALCTFLFAANTASVPLPTIKNMHTLGAGALLAYLFYYHYNNTTLAIFHQYRKILFVVFFALYLIMIAVIPFFKYYEVIRELILALAASTLVYNTVIGWDGLIKKIFTSKPVSYIGKISYGVYLYHMPVPFFYALLCHKYFPSIHFNPLLLLMIFFVITMIVASASYKYLETPFLRLKQKFQ